MRGLYWLIPLGVGIVVARRLAPRVENIDWQTKVAEWPDTFPPKWMFLNITAIREQNDQILALLSTGHDVTPHERAEELVRA